VGAAELGSPCENPVDTVLLRYAAFWDVMTAVFALESHVAGAAFDSAVDRRVVTEVGRGPYRAMEQTLQRYRSWGDPWEHLRDVLSGEHDGSTKPVPPLTFRPLGLISLSGRSGGRLWGPWLDEIKQALSGRPYPEDLATTGWRSLEDYIEEENRHRRIDLLETRTDGFEIRAVLGAGIPYGSLLDGAGGPGPDSEWISWRRDIDPDGEMDRYVIEYGRSGWANWTVEMPIPVHGRVPGPRTLQKAWEFAELYFRAGG
jgi:hypothetical protein